MISLPASLTGVMQAVFSWNKCFKLPSRDQPTVLATTFQHFSFFPILPNTMPVVYALALHAAIDRVYPQYQCDKIHYISLTHRLHLDLLHYPCWVFLVHFCTHTYGTLNVQQVAFMYYLIFEKIWVFCRSYLCL